MFTGLVERLGQIAEVRDEAATRAFRIVAPEWAGQLTLGESIAVDGVCLTVAELAPNGFLVQAVAPTLERTTAGEWTRGRELNLERSLRADGRLGGHFVQGHVDATGVVAGLVERADHVQLDVRLPEVVAEVTVLHGSIAVDGVSLTVSELPADDVARIALIPHTWVHTNLNRLGKGSRVNLEGDMIGRFVVGYLKRWGPVSLEPG